MRGRVLPHFCDHEVDKPSGVHLFYDACGLVSKEILTQNIDKGYGSLYGDIQMEINRERKKGADPPDHP